MNTFTMGVPVTPRFNSASTGGTVVERGYSKPGCVSLSLGHITPFLRFLYLFVSQFFLSFFLNSKCNKLSHKMLAHVHLEMP